MPRSVYRHRALALVITAAMTFLSVLALGAVNPALASAASCKPVFLMAVPGTGEVGENANPDKPVGMLSGIQNGLTSKFSGKVGTYTVPYSASIFSKGKSLNDSAEGGLKKLNAMVKDLSEKCQSAKFAYTGYSQGAITAGDGAHQISQGDGPISADKFVGLYTLADPKRGKEMKEFVTEEDNGGSGVQGSRGSFGSLSDKVATGCIAGGPDGPDMYCAAKGALGKSIAGVVSEADPQNMAEIANVGLESVSSILGSGDLSKIPDVINKANVNKAADTASELNGGSSSSSSDDSGASSGDSDNSSSESPSTSAKSDSDDSDLPKGKSSGGGSIGEPDHSSTADTDDTGGSDAEAGGYDPGDPSDFNDIDPGKREKKGASFGGNDSGIDSIQPDSDGVEQNRKSKDDDKDNEDSSSEEEDKPSESAKPEDKGGDEKTPADDKSDSKIAPEDAENIKNTATSMKSVNDNINEVTGNEENRQKVSDTLRSNGEEDTADMMDSMDKIEYDKLISASGDAEGLKSATGSASELASLAAPLADMAGADSNLTGALAGLTPATVNGQMSNVIDGLVNTDWEDLVNSMNVLGQKAFTGDVRSAHKTAKHIEEELLPLVGLADGIDFRTIGKFAAATGTPEGMAASAALSIFDGVDLKKLYKSTQHLTEALWKVLENPANAPAALSDVLAGGMGYFQTAIGAFGAGVQTGDMQQLVTSGTEIAENNAQSGSSSSGDSSSEEDNISVDTGGSEDSDSESDSDSSGSDSSESGDKDAGDSRSKGTAQPGSPSDPASMVADLTTWANFGQSGAKAHMNYGKQKFTTGLTGIDQGIDFLGKQIAKA